ncbi:MAG: O-antigen ligase family protein [Candidatus Moranbacteria bacterium]|nr:O-antigen ligase family protein [Candidatus Moranbacteria bacterium]
MTRTRADAKTVFFVSSTFLGFLGISYLFGLSPFVPLLAFLGLTALALFIFSPKVFLFILIVVRMSLDYTSQYFTLSVFEHQLTLSEAFGVGIGVIGLLTLVRNARRLASFPLLPPFVLMMLWGALSFFYSLSPSSTLRDLLRIFDLFTFGFLAYTVVRDRNDFKRLLQLLLFSFLVPLLVAFYQSVAGIGFQDESSPIPRIFGTFAHPNVFSLALFAALALGVLYRTEYASSKGEKFLSSSFLVAAGLAMVLTLSRVAWVAAAVFFLILSAYRYRKIILPLILIPVLAFALSDTIRVRTTQTFDLNPDSSIAWRLGLWSDNVRKTYVDGREWYGYGLESFPVASEDLRGIKLGSNEAHNDYVKFFVEGGYIGLIVFLTYVVLILRSLFLGFRNTKDDTRLKTTFGLLVILLLSIEASALSDNVFRNTPLWIVFFSAAGGALSLSRLQTKSEKIS